MRKLPLAAALLALAAPAFAENPKPLPAPPLGEAEARAAAASVCRGAAENLARLANVPVEFAALLAAFPYAQEALPALANPGVEDVRRALALKRAYWQGVKDALAKVVYPADDGTLEDGQKAMAQVLAVSQQRIIADAVLRDVGADQLRLSELHFGQGMIDQKKALYRSMPQAESCRD